MRTPIIKRAMSDGPTTPTGRPKRAQVKNACVNCQRACKKCDEARPCSRCVKFNLMDSCRDSERKERTKASEIYRSDTDNYYDSASEYHSGNDQKSGKTILATALIKSTIPSTDYTHSPQLAMAAEFEHRAGGLAAQPALPPYHHLYIAPANPSASSASSSSHFHHHHHLRHSPLSSSYEVEQTDWSKLQVLSTLCSAVLDDKHDDGTAAPVTPQGCRAKQWVTNRHSGSTDAFVGNHSSPVTIPAAAPTADNVLSAPTDCLVDFDHSTLSTSPTFASMLSHHPPLHSPPSHHLHHTHQHHHHPPSYIHQPHTLQTPAGTLEPSAAGSVLHSSSLYSPLLPYLDYRHARLSHHLPNFRRPWEYGCEEGFEEATVLMNRYTEVGEDLEDSKLEECLGLPKARDPWGDF
ncbi:hypothetical protein DFJ77DRAFT_50125 [Powellomyces hirtus]|nr:hypothetical protein DFJ77DRAFT_50125 [Powellomyces hirtus]